MAIAALLAWQRFNWTLQNGFDRQAEAATVTHRTLSLSLVIQLNVLVHTTPWLLSKHQSSLCRGHRIFCVNFSRFES